MPILIYRTTGDNNTQDRNTTVSHVKINRTVVINKNSNENSELGNWKSILGVSATPNTNTSTGSKKDESTSEPHVTINKQVIIHEGSRANGEPDSWGAIPGLNINENSTLIRNESNENNIIDGVVAKTNAAISNDATKEDSDTPKNILEQKVLKENTWIDETKEGCVKFSIFTFN